MDTNSPPAAKKARLWRRSWAHALQRVDGFPSWLVLTQLFIGFGWLRAVAEKAAEPEWWAGTRIDEFLRVHDEHTLGWYQPFVEAVVVPATPIVAFVVLIGQLGAGVSLLTGKRLALGLGVGMFLNLNFLAAGAVTPSAFYLLAQASIALWMAERDPSTGTVRALKAAALTCVVVGVVSLPYSSTLDPHRVIEDPAIMLGFGGALGALACTLAVGNAAEVRSRFPGNSAEPTPEIVSDDLREVHEGVSVF